MRKMYALVAMLIFTLAFSSLSFAKDPELVRVKSFTRGHKDIVEIKRDNGDVYRISIGLGCSSLYRYEGKNIFVSSKRDFLGKGSELLIPQERQQCDVREATLVKKGNHKPHKHPEKNPCLDEYRIISLTNDGKILVLNNGTRWKVDRKWRSRSMFWFRDTRVRVCGNTMENIREGKTITVEQMR